jgi:hypothetical protein
MNLFNLTENENYNEPRFDRRRLLLMIGGGIAILTIISILLMFFFTDGSKDNLMRIMVKTQELQTLTDASQKRIKSAELAKVNSDANLLLSSDNVALTAQLQKKYSQTGIPADFRKSEADTTTNAALTEAELLNKFDISYRNTLIAKLNSLLPLATQTKNDIGGKEFGGAMDTFIKNLQAIKKQLEALSL